MKVSIVGAGRVGRVLGLLAKRAGHEIGDVVCRSALSARSARKFIGGGEARAQLQRSATDADLILICVADDGISDIAGSLADLGGRLPGPGSRKRRVALHASGAVPSEALAPLRGIGISIGSCHPLQTFENSARALATVAKSYFGIEGDPLAIRAARKFVREIGGREIVVPSDLKGLYHASAVMASGGLVALLSVCSELLSACGLAESESFAALLPLVQGTIDNVRRAGVVNALTGPVRRGDLGTLQKNLTAISLSKPEWLDLYRMLTEASLDLAKRQGMSESRVKAMRRIIKRPTGPAKS